MRIDILRNSAEISFLDNRANQYVLYNFGEFSECVWGLWDDHRNIMGYCTLGYAEGIIPNANYMDLLLSDVFILPKYRRKGHGTYFLREILSLTYAGVYAQILDGSLISFYSFLGFEVVSDGLLYRSGVSC